MKLAFSQLFNFEQEGIKVYIVSSSAIISDFLYENPKVIRRRNKYFLANVKHDNSSKKFNLFV